MSNNFTENASGNVTSLEEQLQPLLEDNQPPGPTTGKPRTKGYAKNTQENSTYEVATTKGLWIVDCSVKVPPEEGEKYRICFLDFFHGFISVLVFGAVALFDQNIVKCLYPVPSEEAKELLATLPLAVGVICIILSICFPSQRHGIGFPLSRH